MLNGKVALVTGAARGIGRSFVEALAGAGAMVVAGDLNDCTDAVAGLDARGIAAHLDVLDMASLEAAVTLAVERFGRLDILVNNAALYGSLKGGRFDRIDEAEWDDCMAVNVKGIWNCCKAAVPAMRKGGAGSIINMASVAAIYGMPYGLHYTTSKGAVIGLTRGLSRELGRDNIRINAIAPTAVMTEGTREFFGDKHDHLLQSTLEQQSIRRNLMPQDITGAMLWLASDASGFVTGQTISVNGGSVLL
jgi:3-oxoacyl-[acyl-carrier protein] reductase